MASRFTAIAIISTYNEADIIEQVLIDFFAQGVRVFVIDDGSTDGTREIVQRHLDRSVIGVEWREKVGDRDGYEWAAILRRKAELAQELDADWFIHNDADEFRESPWPDVPLLAAIQFVDALGFSAIDSERLDFWPVHDDFQPGDDVRESFLYFAPAEHYDRLQIRCWKKTSELIDLASTGGHEARFTNRAVFPIKFLLRHYPIRGQAHAARKIRGERLPRFLQEERDQGWHVQYDAIKNAPSFLRDPATLTLFDGNRVRLQLQVRHREYDALEARLSRLGEGPEESAAVAEVSRLSAEIGLLREQLSALSAAESTARHEIDRLHQSWSWRVTAPMRGALNLWRRAR